MITNSLAITSLILIAILLIPMICKRLHMPSIVGFILVGIAIGPYGFNLIANNSMIDVLGKIGILYIMLQAGIEIDLNDFRQYRRYAITYGIFSFLLPFGLGLLTSRLLGYGWDTSLLLGAMYGSHTLMTYPILNRYGVQKNIAANIAVGGTMPAITLSLLVLASLKSNVMLGADSNTLLLLLRVVICCAVIISLFPRIAQFVFKRNNDTTIGFMLVMAMMVISAYLAEWAGLESILGAFLCGAMLNRLVPNLSPVMKQISFVGTNIFVPLFLIGVGMMIDISVVWSGWTTLLVAVVMIGTKLLGKSLAAWLAQLCFRLQSMERQLIFGLTHATAAGTLAIVTIGHNIGLFDANILNASVIMILVLCTLSSFITEHAAKQLALQEEAQLEIEKEDDSWHASIIGDERLDALQELGQLSELHNPIYSSESDWNEAIRLIRTTSTASLIYHPVQPINTISRILVAVPRYAEKEHDFISCFGFIRRLSSQIGAKVVFFANRETQQSLRDFCKRKGKYLRASFREMEDWEDALMIAKQMGKDDLIIAINARPSTPSYNPLFEQVPDMLNRFFSNSSYILLYPEQDVTRTTQDLLHSAQTPTSTTWSIVGSIKRQITKLLSKIQRL